jgi:hypothetical protein
VIDRAEIEAIILDTIFNRSDAEPTKLAEQIYDALKYAGYEIVRIVNPT